MAQKITVTSDKTGALEEVFGSDNRMNVSSRSDNRSYYISRDDSQAYSAVWDDSSSAAGDFICYLKNTHPTKTMVLDSFGVNSENAASFKLHLVTGTAAGNACTPMCLNRVKVNAAQATCIEAAGTAITGLTSAGVFDHASSVADGHEEFRLQDRLRLGQDEAIAVEYEQGTTGRTWGVSFFFYEDE